MTQAEFKTAGAAGSQTETILAALRAYEGYFVSMQDLASASGSFNVHSRIDELRKRGYRIENKSTRDQVTKKVSSSYRLFPGQKVDQ